MRNTAIVGFLLALGCGAGQAPAPANPVAPASSKAVAKLPVAKPPLVVGREALLASDYPKALAAFAKAQNDPSSAAAATLGVVRVQRLTGRYAEASAERPDVGGDVGFEIVVERALALRAIGKVDEAIALLQPLASASPPRVRLTLGEFLLEVGKRDEAEVVLMTLISDYNDDVIREDDVKALAMVGRAAHFLRSPEDANDAFNQSELAGKADDESLLWRAELFLEKYDPGHAEEVLSEILEHAPHHPDALVMMARVALEQALDFEAVRGLIADALKVNPKHTGARAVLAGLALRDMLLEQALNEVNQGLATNPRDLELLSMLGATKFLSEDQAGFERVRDQVLAYNPNYTRFFQTVGTFADWEHRYQEIVDMMRQAVRIDPGDASAQAALGFNLIRNGDDAGGVLALRSAFKKDPYNVRVYNTLQLYREVIPKQYVDVLGDPFKFRYPNDERAVLERYVPGLMKEAWGLMRGYYGFTPATPVGVELYSQRENFAIRTSGLPRTAISGVCFGKTLASMTPRNEAFNLSMTLWHELAHVFHIQLSKNRVPRWFTEGLAEYETMVARREWRREHDAELFAALREQRLPKLGAMNEAFTHAEDVGDVALAYYASSQIVDMLATNYGRPKLRQMLVLWGEGKRTEEVVTQALGKTTAQLDDEFKAFVAQRLSRYDTQFLPLARVGDPRKVQQAAEAHPDDPDVQVRLALLALRHGGDDLATEAVRKALQTNPKHPDALFLKAKIAMQKGNHILAQAILAKLTELGFDGYQQQMLAARAAVAQQAAGDEIDQALTRAHEFDPTQAEPLYGLLERSRSDAVKRTYWLQKLTELDEHNGDVFRDYALALLEAGKQEEAVEAGLSGVYAAMEDPSTHVVYAKALGASGKRKAARQAFEAALLCPASPEVLAEAHLAYAEFLRGAGSLGDAKVQEDKAAELRKQAPATAPPVP